MIIAFAETELAESTFADVLTTLLTAQVTELAEFTFEDTLITSIALQVIEELESIFAETSKIPPPPSAENGDCENELIPNIISDAHYLITMQKVRLFLDQQSRKTS